MTAVFCLSISEPSVFGGIPLQTKSSQHFIPRDSASLQHHIIWLLDTAWSTVVGPRHIRSPNKIRETIRLTEDRIFQDMRSIGLLFCMRRPRTGSRFENCL